MSPSGDPLVLRLAAQGFVAIAAVLLFAMMSVTTIDVVGRYLLLQPLPGASEINAILLGLMIYFSLPTVCLYQEHIVVGLVFDRLGTNVRRIAGVLINLIGAGLVGLVAHELWAHGSRLDSYSAVTIFLRLPKGPLAHVMAFLSLASALILLANATMIATGRKIAGAPAEALPVD